MISSKEVKYLRDVAIPNLKAMKYRTQKYRKQLEQLKREKMKVLNR